VEALYLLAQATGASAANGDPAQMKDSALAYLRVVAAADGMPGKPHVADALFVVAATEEKLQNVKEAQAVYDQIALEFAGTPTATKAKENAARLAAAASPKS
jgi:TolA-binding protein